MRLTLSALLCAALIQRPRACPRSSRRTDDAAAPGMDMPPPAGFDGPGLMAHLRAMARRWIRRWAQDQDRMRGEWMARCHAANDRPRRVATTTATRISDGCALSRCPGGFRLWLPRRLYGRCVPMVMVPVLRSKPCPEVVEEWVEEVVPAAPPLIPPRARTSQCPRQARPHRTTSVCPSTPSKRIAY